MRGEQVQCKVVRRWSVVFCEKSCFSTVNRWPVTSSLVSVGFGMYFAHAQSAEVGRRHMVLSLFICSPNGSKCIPFMSLVKHFLLLSRDNKEIYTPQTYIHFSLISNLDSLKSKCKAPTWKRLTEDTHIESRGPQRRVGDGCVPIRPNRMTILV